MKHGKKGSFQKKNETYGIFHMLVDLFFESFPKQKMKLMCFKSKLFLRYACAIPDGDTLIVTGGWHPPGNLVTRYNSNGFVEDMPELLKPRWGHGCGFYVSDGQNVILELYS